MDIPAWASQACTLTAFLLPLKLSLAYCVLVPMLAWCIFFRPQMLKRAFYETSAISAPWFILLATLLFSSVAGINFSHSLRAILHLAFFSLTFLFIVGAGKPERIIRAAITGQALAALHSVLDGMFPKQIPSLFLGKVTESGQIGIALLFGIGYVMALSDQSKQPHRPELVMGWTFGIALTLISFINQLAAPSSVVIAVYLFVGILFVYSISRVVASWNHSSNEFWFVLFSLLYLPLIGAALIVNLKRGPWLGVLVGGLLLSLFRSRRMTLAIVTSSAIALLCLPQVQERLSDSYAHFQIAGGREEIWQIGSELALKYPLGVGFHNSEVLRQFSATIPPELRHFHNNLLNLLVEGGWLSLAIFVWWFIAALRVCFRDRNVLHLAAGCALISWQIAGLVEYNVGDSEVLLLLFVLLGISVAWEESIRRKDSKFRADYTTSSTVDPQLRPAPTTAITTN